MSFLKRFLTIFFPAEHVHLYKDVGMIPFCLSKYEGWQCALAYLDNKGLLKDDYYQKYVDLLPIKYSANKLNSFIYLFLFIKNIASRYNVINFYHGGLKNYLLAILLKIFNAKCKVYVKLDYNEDAFRSTIKQVTGFEKVKRKIKSICSHYFIDIYSVETKKFFVKLEEIDIYRDKLVYIPNGVLIDEQTKISPTIKKENIILTVGRIGAYEKNHKLLVDAILKISPEKLKDWKVIFVGPIEKGFKDYVNDVFKTNDYLQEVLAFTGEIINKKELYEFYARAKVFCLPSLWEGFPLVLPEALLFNNYILTTEFPAAYDLTNQEQFGFIFNNKDVQALKERIENIMDEKINLKFDNKAMNYALDNFDWKKIVQYLSKCLTE